MSYRISKLNFWLVFGLGLHDSCKNVNHDFSPWELRSRFSYTILIFFQTKFISTSDCLETTWVSSWGSGLSIWIKIDLWKQGLLFLEPIKIKDRSGRMWDFESFYYVIQNQIVFKLLECHPGVVECQSELKLFCGSRELYFLKPSKITDRRGGIRDLESFYYLIQHQIVLKLLECHPGVVNCQSELKIGLWKQGISFLEPFKITDRRGGIRDLESFYYLIQHQIVLKLLEWHPGVVNCQSELKLFCGSREFYFLKLSKITDRRGGIWDLESFYYAIKNQIVLKLLECHHGVVDCQSKLKLFCGNREFPF